MRELEAEPGLNLGSQVASFAFPDVWSKQKLGGIDQLTPEPHDEEETQERSQRLLFQLQICNKSSERKYIPTWGLLAKATHSWGSYNDPKVVEAEDPPGKLPHTIIFWAKSLENESLLLEMTEIENWRGCVMQSLDSRVLLN